MPTVRILPEILSNQIAAGEVVARPASVVKELMENAIDAGATQITVEVEKGGKKRIAVSDNGHGMSRDDALMSIERYATSKISRQEDLFRISTMGFRGEALPSIASVSRFSIVTRTDRSGVGTRLDIAGGKLTDVSDTGCPVGTMVSVENLFYNTPARKKFLKSDQTEAGHISDLVTGIAMGNPHIRFRLFVNQKLQKNFFTSNDLFQRTVSVLGNETAGKLVKLGFSDDQLQIEGYAANPSVTRSSRSRMYFFVNNRLVYDRGLVAAVFKGYRGRIMKGRFPLFVLFIRIGYDKVDVNVHPTKKEVKFFDHFKVYRSIADTIDQAFLNAQKNTPVYSARSLDSGTAGQTQPFDSDRPVVQQRFRYPDKPAQQAVLPWQKESSPEPAQYLPPQQTDTRVNEQIPQNLLQTGHEREIPPTAGKPVRVIGQIMDTYIIASSGDDLLLIDQHAAHERIVYESLKKRQSALGAVSQDLVVPETIELSHTEADTLETILDDLEKMGLKIEPFGQRTFVIKAIPDLISHKSVGTLVADIIETVVSSKDISSKEDWLEDCLASMACHHAVRANQVLGRVAMDQLVKDLYRCENPMHCPHGRPVIVTLLNKSQLEKLFKRVV